GGQVLVATHLLLIVIRVLVAIDRYTDVLVLRLGFAGLADGQIDLHPLHMHLAQAHHHEAGNHKEHDVDQRNDLDPSFLMANWGGDLHGTLLDGGPFLCPRRTWRV